MQRKFPPTNECRMRDFNRALFEFQSCMDLRQKFGYHLITQYVAWQSVSANKFPPTNECRRRDFNRAMFEFQSRMV